MLAFKVEGSCRRIQVSCDEAGLDLLLSALSKLKTEGGHLHLRGASSGGAALDEKTPWGEGAVEEVVFNWVGE
jgi:hypothetical protein